MGQVTLIVEKLRFLSRFPLNWLVSPFLPVEKRRKFFHSMSESMCPKKDIEKSGCGSNIKTHAVSKKTWTCQLLLGVLLFGVPTTPFHFFSRQVLANFSALSTTPPVRIQKTELRGITIDQLLVPLPPEV